MNNIQPSYPQITESITTVQNNNISQQPINNTSSPQAGNIGSIPPKNTLNRTPDQDIYQATGEMSQLCASIKPQDVQNGLVTATGILIAFKALADAGFDVWDMFTSKFGQPKTKEEEKALKAFLAPAETKPQKLDTAA